MQGDYLCSGQQHQSAGLLLCSRWKCLNIKQMLRGSIDIIFSVFECNSPAGVRMLEVVCIVCCENNAARQPQFGRLY